MSNFFDANFNFEKYIDNRILEISDEDERRAIKEVIRNTLIPFYNNTEEAYHKLAKKIEDTSKNSKGRFQIVTSINNRNKIDITEESMTAMNLDDLEEIKIDLDEMYESLEEGKFFTVMKVYIKADYEEIKKITESNRQWGGVIYTEEGEYQARFRWKQNISYMKQISELYPIFEENNIPWRTVCSPHLAKIFDVDLCETDCPAGLSITKIKVDFEELSEKIVYDIVPVWNVRKIEERSSAFPNFAIDQIHYEHLIFKEKINDDRDYLICPGEIQLWEVFREDKDIHVICDADTPTKFSMFELNYECFERSNEYDIFFNENLEESELRCIHTKADVIKFIKKLGYEKWMNLSDIKVINKPYSEKRCTYSLNSFLEDEIHMRNNNNSLLFVFSCNKPDNELSKDIMSYLVSCLQWYFPEFDCVGTY